jgi:hypothetical protein
MKTLLAILSFVTLSTSAFAEPGMGGMAECISVSVHEALSVYGQNHSLYPIPNVIVTRSDAPPSNGIDVRVMINNSMVYYVIAFPNGGGPASPFKGCTGAQIGRVMPIGG